MAIGKLTIAAAALVVIAIGASAARHPGEHSTDWKGSTPFIALSCISCEPCNVSLCVLLFRISDMPLAFPTLPLR